MLANELLKTSLMKVTFNQINSFHSSNALHRLRLLSKVRCVDNSKIGKSAMMEGRPPKVIHVYNHTRVAHTGN